MKRHWKLAIAAGIVLIVIAVGWLTQDRLGASMLGSELAPSVTLTVGVPALAAGPTSYRGELRVVGVVAGVNPKEHLLSLADRHCRKRLLAGLDAGCMTVPIRWKGIMPGLYGYVQVEGKVVTLQGKPMFVADAVAKDSGGHMSGATK